MVQASQLSPTCLNINSYYKTQYFFGFRSERSSVFSYLPYLPHLSHKSFSSLCKVRLKRADLIKLGSLVNHWLTNLFVVFPRKAASTQKNLPLQPFMFLLENLYGISLLAARCIIVSTLTSNDENLGHILAQVSLWLRIKNWYCCFIVSQRRNQRLGYGTQKQKWAIANLKTSTYRY